MLTGLLQRSRESRDRLKFANEPMVGRVRRAIACGGPVYVEAVGRRSGKSVECPVHAVMLVAHMRSRVDVREHRRAASDP